jgi:hypothetical protein
VGTSSPHVKRAKNGLQPLKKAFRSCLRRYVAAGFSLTLLVRARFQPSVRASDLVFWTTNPYLPHGPTASNRHRMPATRVSIPRIPLAPATGLQAQTTRSRQPVLRSLLGWNVSRVSLLITGPDRVQPKVMPAIATLRAVRIHALALRTVFH